MVSVADFRDIYEYNWRVLRDYGEALAKLPEDELLKNREATHESLKNIFHHILSVHDGWLNVTAQGASADPVMREKDFDEVRSMEPLRGYLEKIIAKEKRFLAKLTDKDLDRGVQPEWKTRPHPLRAALLQVTFEQAHHTGELIALLWQIDVEPPEMTWIDVRASGGGPPPRSRRRPRLRSRPSPAPRAARILDRGRRRSPRPGPRDRHSRAGCHRPRSRGPAPCSGSARPARPPGNSRDIRFPRARRRPWAETRRTRARGARATPDSSGGCGSGRRPM